MRFLLAILLVGALSVLSLAGGSTYWILSRSPLPLRSGGVDVHPTSVQFVPKQAPIVVSLTVNPDRLAAYRQTLAPLAKQSGARREIDRIERGLLANTGIDYDRDVRPWLGEEITWAVASADYDRDASNGTQPGYLLVASAKDGDRAREFLQLYFSRQALGGTSDLVFETYKGANIIYRRPIAGKPQPEREIAATAVGDRYLLFANHPKVLREAINDAQVASLNLGASDLYQRALSSIEETPRIGELYLNVPAIAAWVSGEFELSSQTSPPQTLTAALSLAPGGMRVESALQGIPGPSDRPPVLSEPVRALEYLPADSILAIAGSNLDGLWQQLTDNSDANRAIARISQFLQGELEKQLQVDLEEEIFAWVRGEYALGWVPTDDSSQGDWVFAAALAEEVKPETTTGEAGGSNAGNDDRIAALAGGSNAGNNSGIAALAIARLDREAKAGGWSVGNVALGEETLTAWTQLEAASQVATPGKRSLSLNAAVKGVRVEMNGYEILASSIDSMAGALSGSENSLLASELFRQTTQPLPATNDGYVYLDWARGEAIIERQFPALRVFELGVQPLLEHLRSLALSSRGRADGVLNASLFLELE